MSTRTNTMTPSGQKLIDLDLDPDVAFRHLFRPGRAPRSKAYQLGVHQALSAFLRGETHAQPYLMGSEAADAYFAGWDEGRAEAHRLSVDA